MHEHLQAEYVLQNQLSFSSDTPHLLGVLGNQIANFLSARPLSYTPGPVRAGHELQMPNT